MKKTIAAAAMAASLTAGGMAGMMLGAPGLAGAQTAASDAVSWVDAALQGLVDGGTLTRQQADSVEAALAEARPERPRGGHGGRHLDVVAEALGLTEAELRTALEGGQTLAQVASERGVDVQTVIDALVADKQAALAAAVAAGKLTQEEADGRLAQARERATAMVDGEPPAPGGRGGRDGERPGRGHDTPATEEQTES